jgi:hypothetical protein
MASVLAKVHGATIIDLPSFPTTAWYEACNCILHDDYNVASRHGRRHHCDGARFHMAILPCRLGGVCSLGF